MSATSSSPNGLWASLRSQVSDIAKIVNAAVEDLPDANMMPKDLHQ